MSQDPYERLVYVSSPLRSPTGAYGLFTPRGLRENTRTAVLLAEACWRAGWAAICPHKNTESMDGLEGVPSQAFIKGDQTILRLMRVRQDAVVMGPGWHGSEGCQEEHEVASARGLILVYFETLMGDHSFGRGLMNLQAYMAALYESGGAAEACLGELTCGQFSQRD